MSLTNDLFKNNGTSNIVDETTSQPINDTLNSKYKIDNYAYPSDLFAPDARYGANYAIFYINVQSTSKFIKQNPNEVIPDDQLDITDAKGKGSQLSQLNAKPIDVLAGGAAVTAATTLLTKATGLDLPLNPVGTIGVAGTLALSATALIGQRETKRIKTAIALPIPNDLSTRYNMFWSDDSSLAFDIAARVGGDLVDSFNGLVSGGGIENALKNLKDDSLGVVQNALLAIPGGGSAYVGKANNPKKEQTFQGVDFRPVIFNYRFSPRSRKEYDAVHELIHQFKLHMHPEFAESSYVFIYPSEFDIVYYNNGAVNPHLPKHTSCALRSVNVSYTPNSKFTTFEDGVPSEINLQLEFVELAILTRDDLEVGNVSVEPTY